MNKKLIKLTEQDLHNIVKESVNRILVKEFDDWDAHLQQDDPDPEEKGVFYDDGTEDIYDYAGNYEELIKDELHNLYELERKVPCNMIKEGDMKVNFDMANDLWMYDGYVEEL